MRISILAPDGTSVVLPDFDWDTFSEKLYEALDLETQYDDTYYDDYNNGEDAYQRRLDDFRNNLLDKRFDVKEMLFALWDYYDSTIFRLEKNVAELNARLVHASSKERQSELHEHILNAKQLLEKLQQEFDGINSFIDEGSGEPTSEAIDIRFEHIHKFGNIYNAAVANDDVRLDWDSIEQPEHVKKAIEKVKTFIHRWSKIAGFETTKFDKSDTGGSLYMNIIEIMEKYLWSHKPKDGIIGAEQRTSLLFDRFGVPGLRFLDKFSRNNSPKKQTRNYVTWNEDAMRITGIEPDSDKEAIDYFNNYKAEHSDGSSLSENENTETYNQFIGIDASKRLADDGKIAKSLGNIETLDNAKTLEAKHMPPSFIWRTTGWVKGKDGQWRTEIPDGKIHSSFLNNSKRRTVELQDIYDNDILYTAYPELKHMPVRVQKLKGTTYAMYRYSSSGKIKDTTINQTSLQNKDHEAVTLSLIHEIQHAIQHIEGWELHSFEGKEAAKWKRKIQKIMNSQKDDVRYNLEWAFIYLQDGKTDLLNQATNSMSEETKKVWRDILNSYRHLRIAQTSDYQTYKRAASEVEARNSETRSTWDINKRKNTVPTLSEDTPRKWQILNDTHPEKDNSANFLFPEKYNQLMYHGTRNILSGNRFDLQYLGTGEGAQAYGYGIYLAENPNVSQSYRFPSKGKSFYSFRLPNGTTLNERELEDTLIGDVQYFLPDKLMKFLDVDNIVNDIKALHNIPKYSFRAAKKHIIDKYVQSFFAYAQRNISNSMAERWRDALYKKLGSLIPVQVSLTTTRHNGNLYYVDGSENNVLLDWDARLSEQPQEVLNALTQSGLSLNYNDTGETFYRTLSSELGGDMNASMRLNDLGIPGLRYWDGWSRNENTGTHNFVIWNTDTLRLLGLSEDSDEDAQDYFRAEDYSNSMLDSLDNDSDVVDYNSDDYDMDMEHIDDVANAQMDALDNNSFSEIYNQTDNVRSSDDFLTPESRTQLDALKAKYQPTNMWLKAPNGNDTNLTETQWLLVRTDNFKKWFGDWENDPVNASKVLDDNGEPLVVWHGTDSNFSVFDKTKARSNMDIQGMFFSPYEIDAGGYGENLRPFFLNIKNPASEAQGYKALNMFKGENYAGVKARKYLIDKGFDGINNSNEEFIAFNPEHIKSVIRNNGEFNPDNPEIYKQSIGVEGAKAIDKRNGNTWLMDNLHVAKAMRRKGKSAKTIRLATGWEKGYGRDNDGKWRYEIMDGQLIPEVLDSGRDTMLLSEIFNAPELFAAYPDEGRSLLDITVSFKDLQGKYLGVYNKGDNGITIEHSLRENPQELRLVLIHEIQHAIQYFEGFSVGGNIEMFQPEYDRQLAREKAIREIIDELDKKIGYDDYFKKLIIKTRASGNIDFDEMKKVANNFRYSSAYGDEYKRLLPKLDKIYEERIKKYKGAYFPKEIYNNLAGEVEARNAEARTNFSPEQKRATLLSETEDVTAEKQIPMQPWQSFNLNNAETYPQLHTFSNLKSEAAYRNHLSRKQPETSTADKWKRTWKSIKESARAFRDDFPLLAGEDAEAKGLIPVREFLRIMNRNVSSKAHIVASELHKSLHELSGEQLDLFSRVMLLNDLYAFKRNNPNAPLPLDFTPASLKAEKDKFVALAQNDSKVLNALKAEYANNKKVRQDLINHAEKLGLQSLAKRLQLDDLFLILYAKLLDGDDFNSNYIQALGEMRISMLQDMERLSALEKIKTKYDKKAKLVQLYGKDWRNHVPKGYSIFNPLAGQFIFNAHSLSENVIGAALDDAAERFGLSEQTVNALRSKLSEPFGTQLMVLPDEITKTLRKLSSPTLRGFFGKTFKNITTGWKKLALYFPTRAIKFNIRNMTGDFDAVMAGDSSALKYVPQAVRELTTAYYGNDTHTSHELKEFQARGGALTIQSAQELGDYKEFKEFNDLISQLEGKSLPAWRKLPRQAWNILDKFLWSGVQKFSDFREQWLRYATYLDYLNQMQQNDGIPYNFGASVKDEILAIDDIRDRAFKLSNELLGAYDQISDMGKKMRDMLFPFYSWIEVNAKRYAQLFKNGISEDTANDFVSHFLKGQLKNVPYYTYKVGKTLFFIHLFSILIRAFNWLWAGDAEKELPQNIQERPHITLGHDADGNVLYFDRIGSMGDLLEWFGLESTTAFVNDVKRIFNGDLSVTDFLKQTVAGPFNKIAGALTPLIKTPVELLTGYTTYPDITNPRPINDRAEYLAQSLGLSWPYKAISGKPVDHSNELKNLAVYTRSPRSRNAEQDNYFDMRDRVRRFKSEVLGKDTSGSYSTSKRSDTLRNLKAALRKNDKEAAKRFISEYLGLNGNVRNLKAAIKRMHPLYGLSRKERNMIEDTLSPQEKTNLERAIHYYESLLNFFSQVW
ncbi:MAG: hypothetical protein IJ587_04965 [Synergistaceae bacterium]|nr:hypothetical protein [Synergistaceae bacterium]